MGVPDWAKEAGKFVAYGGAGYVASKVTGVDPIDIVGNIISPPSVPQLKGPDAPPPPPDPTDELVQRARAAQIRRQQMGQGLASTFLTGPLGDLMAPPTSKPAAGGY